MCWSKERFNASINKHAIYESPEDKALMKEENEAKAKKHMEYMLLLELAHEKRIQATNDSEILTI